MRNLEELSFKCLVYSTLETLSWVCFPDICGAIWWGLPLFMGRWDVERAPLCPIFTPPQEAGLQTHPTSLYGKHSTHSSKEVFFQILKFLFVPCCTSVSMEDSPCAVRWHGERRGRLAVHSGCWKTWPALDHCWHHSSTMCAPVRRGHSSGSRNPTGMSLVNISGHQKSQ